MSNNNHNKLLVMRHKSSHALFNRKGHEAPELPPPDQDATVRTPPEDGEDNSDNPPEDGEDNSLGKREDNPAEDGQNRPPNPPPPYLNNYYARMRPSFAGRT
ncbi:hypothetical protein ACLB2K_046921 [Fragaria x ananassa]